MTPPRPANWDALCAAYASGDSGAIAREEAVYSAQLVAAGLPPLRHTTLFDPDTTVDVTAPRRSPMT
jgi:hypothetical protein